MDYSIPSLPFQLPQLDLPAKDKGFQRLFDVNDLSMASFNLNQQQLGLGGAEAQIWTTRQYSPDWKSDVDTALL